MRMFRRVVSPSSDRRSDGGVVTPTAFSKGSTRSSDWKQVTIPGTCCS